MKRPTTLAGRTFLGIAIATVLVLAATLVAAAAATGSLAPEALGRTSANASLRTLFEVFGAGALVLAVIVPIVISRSVTRPLRCLMKVVRESERTGRLTPAFPEDSPMHDLNRLAGALNGAARSAHQSRTELDRACLQFIETMAQALDARDPYTAGHSLRVGAYSRAIALEMGLPEDEAETICIAAQLHDVGKIGVPDAVLLKPAALTNEECGMIEQHPRVGRKILEKVGKFDQFLPVVELHHENHDGSGYPYGLSGESIPVAARIVHVADCFDAMTTNRSYRSALPVRAAITELKENAGTQFDPAVVEVLLALIANGKQDEILMAAGRGRPAGDRDGVFADSLPMPVTARR